MTVQGGRFIKMKFRVEVLKPTSHHMIKTNPYPDYNISETFSFDSLEKANKKFNKMKLEKNLNHRLRLIEYHNDEPDKIRKPCKILNETKG